MAKVTITFEDSVDGDVDINAEFDPAMPENPDEEATDAQRMAGYFILDLRDSPGTLESSQTDTDGNVRPF